MYAPQSRIHTTPTFRHNLACVSQSGYHLYILALQHRLHGIIIAALFAYTDDTHLHGTRLHRLQVLSTSILP